MKRLIVAVLLTNLLIVGFMLVDFFQHSLIRNQHDRIQNSLTAGHYKIENNTITYVPDTEATSR